MLKWFGLVWGAVLWNGNLLLELRNWHLLLAGVVVGRVLWKFIERILRYLSWRTTLRKLGIDSGRARASRRTGSSGHSGTTRTTTKRGARWRP